MKLKRPGNWPLFLPDVLKRSFGHRILRPFLIMGYLARPTKKGFHAKGAKKAQSAQRIKKKE
jgi:hypothetical protein